MYYQNYEDYMRQVLGYPINDPNIYETYDYKNDYQNRKTYEDTYFSRNQSMSNQNITNMSEDEIKSCYPEIYHLVYPMVCKVCDANTEPITRQLIDRMTDEVYNSIEDRSTVVNIRVDTPKQESRSNESDVSKTTSKSKSETRTTRTPAKPEARSSSVEGARMTKIEDFRTPKSRASMNSENATSGKEKKTGLAPSSEKSIVENREVSAKITENRQSNSSLRDLIRILLLFRLFGNQPNRPRPPRPPFPGGPGPGRPSFPGGRPPIGPGGPTRPPVIQPRDYQDYLEF